MAAPGKGGLGIARDRNDADIKLRKGRKEIVQLLGFPAVAQRQDQIAVRYHAQVAVQRIDGMQHHRRAAGARERRRNFFPDVPGFSDAGDNHFAAGHGHGPQRLDRQGKLGSQTIHHALDLRHFNFRHTTRDFEMRDRFRHGRDYGVLPLSGKDVTHAACWRLSQAASRRATASAVRPV